MSAATANIIKAVRRQWPAAALKSDGSMFWIEAGGEVLGLKKSTTAKAWCSAFDFAQHGKDLDHD